MRPRSWRSSSSAACQSASTESASVWWICSNAPRRSPPRRGHRRSTSRTRIAGSKVRDIYEAPAAAILLPAHQELEKLVCTIHQNQFKAGLDRQWAYLVYAGLWWEPLRADLDAYMESVNAHVNGTIGLKLYKGHARVVTRSSPGAVYDQALASFSESAGCSPRPPPQVSSSCGLCSRAWPGVCVTASPLGGAWAGARPRRGCGAGPRFGGWSCALVGVFFLGCLARGGVRGHSDSGGVRSPPLRLAVDDD